jgi:aromatic-L-amino-acid decarboxylase
MTWLASELARERDEALEHGLDLLRETWRSFDAARPDQPALSDAVAELVAAPLPANGVGLTHALDDAAGVLDQSLAQSRPRYFGYVGSSGLGSAVLGDALAASHDVNLAAESGAAHRVEQQTLRWVGELVGYPVDGGTFASGGMVSNLTALAAARTRALPDSRTRGVADARPTVYTSADAHSSVERAVEVLGLGRDNLRSVPVDARRRMDAEALRRLVAADVADGRTPIAVVATAGTTLTGAVDPIGEIAEVCAEHGVWLHVDGAYGLPGAATMTASPLYHGLERADSVTVDAHKWLFVPKACSVLMVRDAETLRTAFAHHAPYMLEEEGYAHPVDTTLEYSRPFRSLKLWLALRAHGANPFRTAIAENLRQAQELYDQVLAHPRMEPVLDRPDLSIVPFRRIPAVGDVDRHNMRLARAMQEDGRVYLTSAVIDGVGCLRPCLVNFRTTDDDVRAILEVADELGARLEASEAGEA